MFWNGTRFTEKGWGVDWKEMMMCGCDGGARMEKRTRKEAKWKIRTRQDRSLRNRVVQFTNGAAQGGARTCRCATDAIHCRVWWKDKFPRFSVFWNCRSSEKRSATIGWSMNVFVVMQSPFPIIQKEKESLIASSREPCEEPDCMCSENCVVWTSTWA